MIAAHAVFAAIKAIFLPHEGVRVFGDFLADSLVGLQIGLQRRVALHKLLVVY